MDKRNIKVAILTGVIFYALYHILFSIKFGMDFYQKETYLKYFMPIWTVVSIFCGYGFSKMYYAEKIKFITDENPTEQMKKNWFEHLLYLLGRGKRILATMFALAFPTYLLAYLDHSEYLKSSLGASISFLVLSIICWIFYRLLNKRYIDYLNQGKDE